MDIYKVDVTGDDILSKKYSVLVHYKSLNVDEVFAYKFSSELQRDMNHFVKEGSYGVKFNHFFKPRVYTSTLSMILDYISRTCTTSPNRFELHICRDFSGHEKNIIERLRSLTQNIFEEITSDHHSFVKHNAKSKIQQAALQLNKGDWTGIHKVPIDVNKLHNVIARKSYRKNRW